MIVKFEKKKKFAYVLRTCKKDMTSANRFKWPESGKVVCPDWDPRPVESGGLHGLLYGEGSGSLLRIEPEDKWIVVKVDLSTVVALCDSVKFPEGEVVYCGDRQSATDLILKHYPGSFCAGALVVVGDNKLAMVGDFGQATAGCGGKAIALDHGQAIAGSYGTAEAGIFGQALVGSHGHAESGRYGQAVAGCYGTANAKQNGHAIAGDYGQASAGEGGIATVGLFGVASAGVGGIVEFHWIGGEPGKKRIRVVVGHIGEGGLLPNVSYKLNKSGKIVKA